MRVLAVIPGEGKGSSFIFARRQVQALIRSGVSVDVFYLRASFSLIQLWGEWVRLRKMINKLAPDIIHAHYGTMTAFLCVMATTRPIAITFRGSDLNSEPGISQIRSHAGHLLSQLANLRASIVICVSSQLRDRLWWRKRRALVIPTGLNLESFHPIPKEQARQDLGWNPDERIVLFNSGRNPLVKGRAFAFEAVERARKLAGPIELFELDGSVPPERMPILLNAADCLVIASVSEGSPTILQEAMACNLPVASVDVGDAAERLRGVHPSQVVPRNSNALAQAIADILKERCRSNGRDKVTDCSDERVVQQTKSAFFSLRPRDGASRSSMAAKI